MAGLNPATCGRGLQPATQPAFAEAKLQLRAGRPRTSVSDDARCVVFASHWPCGRTAAGWPARRPAMVRGRGSSGPIGRSGRKYRKEQETGSCYGGSVMFAKSLNSRVKSQIPGLRTGARRKIPCISPDKQEKAHYERSAAPVALATAATIFCAAASISASVRVLSFGCSLIATATDFLPSATPLPS